MENLDKIIPLIVLVFFVINSIRSFRKKNEENQQSSTSSKIPTNPQQKKTTIQQLPQSRHVKYEAIYNPEDVEPVHSVFSDEKEDKNRSILLEEIDDQSSFDFDLNDIDKAKTAIIYSEILGRKYE